MTVLNVVNPRNAARLANAKKLIEDKRRRERLRGEAARIVSAAIVANLRNTSKSGRHVWR